MHFSSTNWRPWLFLVPLMTSLPAVAAPKWPWDAPSFSWSGQAGLQALGNLPKRSPALDGVPASTEDEKHDDILLRDTHVVVDAEERETVTEHLVYWVRSLSDADGWNVISADWHPWYQSKPIIRARVISPDGEVHAFDPATLTVDSANHDGEVFTDDQRLSGPLPAVGIGCLVETEIVTRDSSSFFAGGLFERQIFWQGWLSPREAHLIVETPEAVSFRDVVRGTGVSVRVITHGPTRTLMADAMQLSWPAAGPFSEPEEEMPSVMYSTGSSWHAIASGYARMVESRLQSAHVKTLADAWAGSATAPRDVMRNLLAQLHKTLRYTALELGAAAITPVAPEVALKREYGDCKDLSTLLVALLRAKGILANVALVRADGKIEQTLPGLSQFNHVIVQVSSPFDLWIDPTDPGAPLGELPSGDQDIQALIVSKDTTGLVRTPSESMTDSQEVVTRRAYLMPQGPGRIIEEISRTGHFARDLRDAFHGHTTAEMRQSFQSNARRIYSTDSISEVRTSTLEAMNSPFLTSLTAEKSPVLYSAEQDAMIWFSAGDLLESLPQQLKRGADDANNQAISIEPGIIEAKFDLFTPPGFTPEKPADLSPIALGPLRLTDRFESKNDRETLVTLRLEIPVRKIAPADVAKVRAGVEQLEKRDFSVHFVRVPWILAMQGKVRLAIDELEAAAREQPKEAAWPALESRIWILSGAGRAGVAAARRAVFVDHESAYAWQTLALALSRDSVGRPFKRGFDRDGALAAIRQVVRIQPMNKDARVLLAALLMHNDGGEELGAGCDAAAAAQEIAFIRRKFDTHEYDVDYLRSLFATGQYKTIRDSEPTLDGKSQSWHPYVVAAHLLTSGVDDAWETANRLDSDAQTLRADAEMASRLAGTLRHYKEELGLMQKLSPHGDTAVFMSILQRMVNPPSAEASIHTGTGPADVALQAARGMLMYPEDGARIRSLVTPLFFSTYGSGWLAHQVFGKDADSEREDDRALRQAFVSRMKATVRSTNLAGTEVRLALSGAESPRRLTDALVVRDGGTYRVAALSSTLDLAGAEAMSELDAGKIDAARAALRWAADAQTQEKREVTFPVGDPSIADTDELRATAALFMTTGRLASQAVPIARTLLNGTHLDAQIRVALAESASEAAMKSKDYDAAWQLLAGVLPPQHVPRDLLPPAVLALRKLHRYGDVQKLVEERLRDAPDDPAALHAEFSNAVQQGDLVDAVQLGRAALAKLDDDETAGLMNDVAWTEMVIGRDGNATYRLAQKASERAPALDLAPLHTFAAVAADTGHLTEARESLMQLLDHREQAGDPIQPVDWFIVGRLYEAYGLRVDAIDAYRKVMADSDSGPLATRFVAERRMDALERAAAGP